MGDRGEKGKKGKKGKKANNSDNGGRELSAGERLVRLLDIPCDVLPSAGLITIRGRGEFTYDGISRIIEYKKERISLMTRGGRVTLRGSGLECSSFSGGRMSVAGRIDSVSFAEKGESGEEADKDKIDKKDKEDKEDREVAGKRGEDR